MSASSATIIAIFTFCNVIRIVAYIPQMLCIARDRHGASSISFTSWTLFAVSHVATALYALLLLSDWWLAVNFAANAVCCAIILVLTSAKRRERRFSVPEGRQAEPG